MWFAIHHQQVTIRIYAKPHASRTAIVKVDEEALHIAIHAKPHEGEANKALISFLSDVLKIPKTTIKLQRGEHSRHKVLAIPLCPTTQAFLDNPFTA